MEEDKLQLNDYSIDIGIFIRLNDDCELIQSGIAVKDAIYKVNAFSDASQIFNFEIPETGAISKVIEYSQIKEFVKERSEIDKFFKSRNKKVLNAIEALRIKGKLVHPDDILPIVNDIFGEDRVYISKEQIDRFYNDLVYSIYIHFPVLNITNTWGDKHEMQDLYVKFTINLDSSFDRCYIEMQGRRLTASLKEYESSYAHSHLSRSAIHGFETFCLGSSDFARLIMDVKLEMSETCWNLMFMSLENYLKWESIEGGPYKFMRDITYSRTIDDAIVRKCLSNIIQGIDRKNWQYDGDTLSLKDVSDVYDYFDKYSELRRGSGYKKEEADEMVKIINEERRSSILPWKNGEVIKFRAYNDITTEKSKLDVSVIEKYAKVIYEEFEIFNLKKTKDEYKQRNYEKIFGEVSTVKQA